ncbi:single hybrid motif-containing protein [Jaminaea rosea]|uniref:Single hybrid motif-containing protein n=1 Tax=Jaminaea rosea TaxID=1569628 RepID=A0A316UKA8_9BASI|nr:single hybrid motif-containing protein [Jaminaea rosea]PWN24801.1 single hybrid motif-containing protein [Jaminaea rosea]
MSTAAMRTVVTRALRGAVAPSSSRAHAFSKFAMPAMSPTMTEGGLATWKVKEGQSFSAGDVLLEIETDKATMDVEAQDDGVMGKIVVGEGAKNVQVGKTIAILAEEGDDLSEAASHVDKEGSGSASPSSSSSSSPPSSSGSGSGSESSTSTTRSDYSSPGEAAEFPSSTSHQPVHASWPILFPSVLRLLGENNVSAEDAKKNIKGTGRRGLVTKGDVLVYLGKAEQPAGTATSKPASIADLGGAAAPGAAGGSGGKTTGGTASPDGGKSSGGKSAAPLEARELRAAILGGLALNSKVGASRAAPAVAPAPTSSSSVADAVADYQKSPASPSPASTPKPAKKDWLEGLI